MVRHAAVVSTRPAADQTSSGVRSVNGTPDTSETVSATNSAAHIAHTTQATAPTRTARYPSTSSTPLVCGGTRKAANKKCPIVTIAAISPAPRRKGSP